MMGDHMLEESDEEKYLGDIIHTDGTGASIISTISKRINNLNEMINLAEHIRMAGIQNSRCAGNLYESEAVTSIMNNSESWIGIPDEAIDMLQYF